MAEEHHHHKTHECEPAVEGTVETQDRGIFDFLGKKEEEKVQEEVIVAEFEEKVQVSEPCESVEEPKEEKHGFLEKLHRSDSSSSSVSFCSFSFSFVYRVNEKNRREGLNSDFDAPCYLGDVFPSATFKFLRFSA